jgi:dimethylaniline monooxygenase (N-oxide forming)
MVKKNRPWKAKKMSILERLGSVYADRPEDAGSDKVINTCTWPQYIRPNGVVEFTPDSSRPDYARMMELGPLKPEIVIAGTGYVHSFPWLSKEYPNARDARVREIIAPGVEDIAFIGFVRPGVGAIPPMAEMQALWWTALVTGKMRQPNTPGHYHLQPPHGARVDYGVDHITYVATLARDFGALPGLWELWTEYGTKVTLCYCLGTAYNSFYRLVGPFKSERALNTVRDELWQLVLRRGWIYTIFFSLIPLVFWGSVNALTSVLDAVGLLPEFKSMEEKMANINGKLSVIKNRHGTQI